MQHLHLWSNTFLLHLFLKSIVIPVIWWIHNFLQLMLIWHRRKFQRCIERAHEHPRLNSSGSESVLKTRGRLPERIEAKIFCPQFHWSNTWRLHLTLSMLRLHLWLVNVAPALESSSSSAAHAATTRNNDIDEMLTSIINVFNSYREIFSPFECDSSSSTTTRTAPVQAPSQPRRRAQFTSLPGAFQDTVWLQTRGHLCDTPDFESVMVWTVQEMASFGRGLGIPLPFLWFQQDAGYWRTLWRRQILFVLHIFVGNQECCTHNSSPSMGLPSLFCREGSCCGIFKDVRVLPMLNFGHFWAALSKMSCRLRRHTMSIVSCVFLHK